MKLPSIKGSWKRISILLIASILLSFLADNIYQFQQVQYRENAFSYVCTLVLPKLQVGAQREAQETLNALFSKDLKSELVFPSVIINNKTLVRQNFTTSSNYVCHFDSIPQGKIVFSYNKKELGPLGQIGVAVFFLIILWIGLTRIESYFERRADLKTQYMVATEMSRIARQVAHDIRSPLSALSVVIPQLKSIDVERGEILAQVTNRLQLIADDLLNKYRPISLPSHSREQDFEVCEVLPSIRSVIEEKSSTSSHALIKIDGHDLIKIGCRPIEFERVISNLVQNSIEAGTGSNRLEITVYVRRFERLAQISISDNGQGIPPDILEKLGKTAHTSKGSMGNGLGFLSSKERVASWGGSLSIESRVGFGTIVHIKIPTKQ